jgi:PAS domain S-box-containing protein
VLVLAAAVPLLALIAFGARRQIALERASALERAQDQARNIAARVDDQLGNIDTLLIGLAQVVSLNPDDIAKNEALFRAVRADLPPYFLNVKAHAPDGHPLGSSSGNRESNVVDRRYFYEALEGAGFVVGDPVISRTTGKWTLTLSRPLFDDEDRVAGMVGATIELAMLEPLLLAESLPAGSAVSLLDQNAVILGRSTESQQFVGTVSTQTDALEIMMGRQSGTFEFDAPGGSTRLAGFWTCGRAPWKVYVRVPAAVAFAGVERQFMRSLTLSALTLSATLVLAWIVANRITRPIRQLAAEAATLGAGGALSPSEVDSSGEVGQLAGAFNQMLVTLEQRDVALRQSEAQVRALIEQAADGIFITDRAGMLIDVNASGARMLGSTREELQGRELSSLLVEEGRAEAQAQQDRLAEGEAVVSTRRYLRPDGTTFPGEVSVKRLSDGRLLHTLRDVSERERTAAEREQFERKLQETQKLESLGVLAGGIAHDFNNILTGILGNASLAALEVAPASPAQTNLEHIRQASLRAADLCKQMLAYSGRGRFVVQRLNLNRLIEDTIDLLKLSISKQSILRFNLHPSLPAIEADATQMRQVIMNLVINASEAIGEKSGVISLNTGLTRVDKDYLGGTILAPELPEGSYVYFEVSDTGCGMNAATQARIFEPFFTTKFAGRGLGLAAVLGIVRGHKGAMKIYSEPGRGTTFKLLFPCATGTEEAIAGPTTAPAAWRGHGCVLVVDDEETVRTTAALMLKRVGFDVALASDGREAVEIFAKTPGRFDLVLMDLTMPHMDGEEAFTELRRLRPDVRVVLMSGFNQQEAVARFTGKGLASFLQKPFPLDGLTAVLKRVLPPENQV